jgi:uncharacterized protein (TIGR03067 family)
MENDAAGVIWTVFATALSPDPDNGRRRHRIGPVAQTGAAEQQTPQPDLPALFLKHRKRFAMIRTLSAACIVVLWTATCTLGGDHPDVKALEGKWKVAKVNLGDGLPPPPADKSPIFTFKGGRFIVEVPGQKSSEGRLVLDPTKKPKHINMHIEVDQTPKNVGMTVEGIYEFRGDTLLLCIKEPGKGRPTSFENPAGVIQILATLEKVKD